MADPILTVDGVYGPGEIQTPEQLPAYIPATPMPEIDFNAYRNGLSGGAGQAEDYESSIRRKLAGVSVNRAQNQAFTPIAFNSKESGFDPIYNSFKDSLYRTEGFIPGRDNEDLYARELGKSGQLWQGLKGILPLAGIAHNEAWKSEADMWSNLLKGDFKKAFSMTMDREDMLKLNQLTNDVNNSNFVPLTLEQREGSLNMGKFARGIQQFGFTLGTTAQFLEQTALEMGVAALTAPETGFGSVLAEIGNITRRAAKAIKTVDKFYDVNKAFAKVMKFENTYLDANKVAKIFNGLNDVRKASPIGSFGNFYRFTKEYNFAASEARFERAQSYADYIETKERDFFQENGRMMSEEEKAAVEQQAMDISNANGVTNIALLFAMNRLNMGNVLRTGFGLSKAIAAETGTIADNIVMRAAKPNVLSKYFKKKAAKETAKAADGPFMKASDVKMFSSEWFRGKGNSTFRWGADSAWEGVQEVAQSVSGEYWKNYYSEKATLSEEARNDWGHLMGLSQKALGKAIGAQNSQEGLDTFISGFIIGVPSVAMNKAIGYGQKKMFSKEYADKERRAQEAVDSLNKWAASPMQVFNRNLEGYVNQTEIAEGMKKAAKEKNPYAFKNLERKAFQEFVMTSHKAGKLDAMLDMMQQASVDLSDEQFKETFGIESDSINRKSAKDYVSNLRSKAEEMVKTYDDVARRMPNPVNYKQFKEGTFERVEAEVKHVAWNKTLEDYVFQRDAHKDVVVRYKDILAKNQEKLGSQAYEAFYKMTNVEFVDTELGILNNEIRMMNSSETLTKDQRGLLKEYTKKQELLTKWKAELGTMVKPGEISAPATPSKTFTDFLNIYQRANGMPELEADKVRDAFNDLSDLFRLEEDQRKAIKNLNFLADPDNFNKLFNMHNELLSNEHKNLMKQREEKSANYDKILPMVRQDADFRAKHYKLIEQLEQAIVEQNGNLYYDILDKIYEAEFGEPVVGKEEEEVAEGETAETPADNNSVETSPPASNTPGTKGSMRLEGKKLIIEGVGEIDFTGNTKDTDFATMMPEVTQILKNWDAQWVNDNLVNFNGQFIFNYNGRVMVLVRAGNFIVPFYFSSSGTSGKKIDWHYIFGIDNESDWIIKGGVDEKGEVVYSKNLANRYPNAIKRLEELKTQIREKLPLDNTSKVEVGKLVYQNRSKYNKNLLDIYKGLDVVDNVGQDGVETNENYTYLINATLGMMGLDVVAGSGNQAPKPPAPAADTKVFDGLKEELAKASTTEELISVLKKLNNAIDEELITEDQYDDLITIGDVRKKELFKNTKTPYEKTAEFVKEYNELLDSLEAVLANPDVSVKDVTAAFRTMNPILAKLDSKVRMKFQKPLEEKRKNIIQLIEKRDAAKDINGIVKFITDTLSDLNRSIAEAVDAVFEVLDMVIDPAMKDQVITHFEQEYERSINARVAALSRKASVAAAGSPLMTAMMEQRNKFILEVEASLERLKKQSEDLAAKKGNLVFTVDVIPGFSTSLNTIIQGYKNNYFSTQGQQEAIDNLLLAGVLGQEDLSKFSRGDIKGASSLVNQGVSRIFALQINKAAEAFTKDKTKLTELKNVLKDYFASRIEDEATLDKRKKFVDEMAEDLDSGSTVEEILSIFGINKTQEVSDEQYKLLGKYRKAVINVINDANLLDAANKIEARKQQVITESVKDISEFVDSNTVNLFKSMLKSKDTAAFKDDLVNTYNKISGAKSAAQVALMSSELAERHMKKGRSADAAEIINALFVAANEMMSASGPETGGVELTQAELLELVNGKSTKVLNTAQIEQVKDFAKVYLDEIKKKLKAASGYVPGLIILGEGRLAESFDTGTLKFISLRPKMSSDMRTADDLAKELKVADNKVSIKDALSFISNSNFATDTEKYLAKSISSLFDADAVIIIDNELDSVGEYDSETNEIRINLSATGYSSEMPSSALETVILHEIIHAKVEDAIADSTSEYGRSIRSVFNAVKDSDNAKYFYAFSNELQPDEQLREFVTEAFTNPAFQYMLAQTPYANSKKTTWQVFLDIIKKVLAKLGVDVEDNALNEVLNLTSEILNASAGDMLERIGQAGSVADLSSLRSEIRKLKKKFKIDDEEYNVLSSAITANSRQFRVKELNQKLKNSTKVMVEGKTYHYIVDQSDISTFEVYTIGPKGPRRVRSTQKLEPIILELAKKAGFAGIMEATTVEYIKDKMGDPKVPGTYASGEMRDSDPEGFIKFPEMYLQDPEDLYSAADLRTPSLKFRSMEEFERFERKFSSALVAKRKYGDTRYGQLVKEMEAEFGAIAVKGYGEVFNTIGSVSDVRKLIRKKVLSVDSKASEGLMDLIYDTDNAVLDFLRYVHEGGLYDKTQEEAIRTDIKKALDHYFGYDVPAAMQARIEDELSDLPDVPPPPPGPDPMLVITTKKSTEAFVQDLTALDYAPVQDTQYDRSAQNFNPLRSTANDIFYDKQTGEPKESNAYREYYGNVREVINALHLKPDTFFTDLRVTLDKNNSSLRWDGSAVSENYNPADNPVIGYISDTNGNPIIFNRNGDIVGQLDKNNLDDQKGLDNGENQIVYFHLPKEADEFRFDLALLPAFQKAYSNVLAGKPQIARISRITPGVMNFMDMANPSTTTSKNTAKNPEFKEQLMKSNVAFSLNRINGSLNAVVTAPDGAKNTRGLFPSDSRMVSIDVGNGPVQLSGYVFEVMKTYLEMKLKGENMAGLGNIENDLIPFIYNIWLTGSNHKLKIPQNFQNIRIKVPDLAATTEMRRTDPSAKVVYKDEYYKVFEINYATKQVDVIPENLNKVLKYINKMPVNIWSQWLDGSKPFRFPAIVQENGEKSIKFVEKDYLQFLMDEVGLKAYFLEIPAGSDIKRYNSIVEYTIPTDLTPTTVNSVSQQDIINDSEAVQKQVDENVTAATGNSTVKNMPKRTKFRAPKLQNIYEKTCK